MTQLKEGRWEETIRFRPTIKGVKSMAEKAKITSDHNTIRKWAEGRGGKPASVKGTEKGKDAGVLRIVFPRYGSEKRLEEITWEEFFVKFDQKKLAFLYQNKSAKGKPSRFFKMIKR